MRNQSSQVRYSVSLDNFDNFSKARALSQIQIEDTTAVKFKDYIKALEIGSDWDPKRINLESYIYTFSMVITDSNSSRKTRWQLNKRYSDFVELSKKLEKEFSAKKGSLVYLPKLFLYNEDDQKNSIIPLRNLNSYLMDLIQNNHIRTDSQTLYEFLELSLLQLPEGTVKFKEGYMKKRTGGRYNESRCQIYCSVFFRRWHKRWCVITNEGIIYTIDVNSIRVRETLLFDRSFQLEFGRKATGSKNGIILSTSNRKLHLLAEDNFQTLEWIAAIKKAVEACPYVRKNRYESFAPVRHPTAQCKWYVDGEGYFSDLCDALLKAKKEVFITDWWLSPELYLKRPVKDEKDVENRLDQVLGKIAKRGVKVNIILYREVKLALYNDSEYTKKILQGMSPNIRVMRHPNQLLFMWSHHEKMVVIDQSIGFLGGLDLCYGRMDLNSHPLHDPAFEKGEGHTFPGIDFSNARQADFRNVRDFTNCLVDRHTHPRMPWHDIAMMVIGEPVRDLARHFIQYWNFAEIDLRFRKDRFLAVQADNSQFKGPQSPVAKPEKVTVFKNKIKELLLPQATKEPGSYFRIEDDGSGFNLANNEGESVEHQPQRAFDKYLPPRALSTTDSKEEARLGTNISKITERESEDEKDHEEDDVENKEKRISRSLEQNKHLAIVLRNLESDAQNAEQEPSSPRTIPPFEITKKRSNTMRSKSSLLKIDDRGFLTQNINETDIMRKRSQSLKNKSNVKFDKQYNDLQRKIREKEMQICNQNDWYMTNQQNVKLEAPIISRELSVPQFKEEHLELSYSKIEEQSAMQGTCSCQVLRSAANWSLGLKSWEQGFENSIQVAYIDLIKNSKKFIFIENQFFISSTAGEPVTNEVVRALLFRIKKAHDDKEKFRIVVFLPLLPGFEGEVDVPSSAVLRIQLHWEYLTISRGGTSLYEELAKMGINPDDYIRFYSLRQHEKMNDVPVTEIIYIHSKLMIVDDEVVIMGSANINDRSMQGSRDSEIAVIVEDRLKVNVLFDGKETKVAKFAHTLRKALYMEHLGASGEEVEDPLNEALIEKMNTNAQRNTEIFRKVFGCYPDDNIKKISEVKEFKAKRNLEEYDNLAQDIVGHIVEFPLRFLEQDQLSFAMSDKEYYVPATSFT